MPVIRELDVRTIPPPRRHPEIFALFDQLSPGDAFVLVNDHDPKPLLYQFQAIRPGAFEWSYLEAGPERFRVEIARRHTAGPRTVTDCLEADHRRLDAIVPLVRKLVAAAEFPEASARFGELACGLDRHIDIEEQVLFPVFEKLTGLTAGGPTFVMRREHEEIRHLLGRVTQALDHHDAADVAERLQELVAVLGAHNQKEERVLYPMTDQAAGDERARDDLVKRLQTF